MSTFLKLILGLMISHWTILSAQPLTLSDARQMSKNNNLTLQQQVIRLSQAQREIDIQQAGMFPKISVNGLYAYNSAVAVLDNPNLPLDIQAGYHNVYDLNLTLQQPLFTGFRHIYLVKTAQEEHRQTQSIQQATTNQILLRVHQLFHGVQLNMLQQEVLHASLVRATQDLQLTANFLRAGQISAFDTMKVSNGMLNLKTQLNQLQHNQQVLLSQLSFILNVPRLDAVSSLPPGAMPAELETLEWYDQQARQNRPEISHLHYKTRAQTYRTRVMRSGSLPQIFLQARYHYARPGINFFRDEWMDYYQISVNFQWDLWNRGKVRNQVAQNHQAGEILNLEEKKLLNQIEQEVEEAYQNLMSDRDQIVLLRNLVVQEKERYRIIREKYHQGLTTTLDLSEAESAWTASDLQLQQIYVKWLQDKALMAYATGVIAEQF